MVPKSKAFNDLFLVTLIFSVWRGALFLFDFVSLAMTTEFDSHFKTFRALPGHWFWDSLCRWDSGWYSKIVNNGYLIEGGQSNVVFFPLYPYLVKGLTYIVGNHWVAGILISNLSIIAGLFFMLRIARLYLDEEGARRSLVYFLVFPASFFLSAYYTEGLFFALTSASFYFYLNKRFLPAGILGALATMTRSTGIALLGAYIIGTLWNNRFRLRGIPASFLWVFLTPLGLIAFMAILHFQVGDAFSFSKFQSGWGRSGIGHPFNAFVDAIQKFDWTLPRKLDNTYVVLSAVSSLLFLFIPALGFGRIDFSLTIFSYLLLCIPLSTGSVLSMIRFEAVIFPAFIALSMAGKNRSVDRFIVCASGLFLGLLNVLFANWYWIV